MKVAFISDIHGNLEALTKVLDDIEKRNVDRIICLGDTIAKGVHPNECIKLVREKCDIVLRGNCDRYFTEKHDVTNFPLEEKKRINWNQKMITEENKDYLQNLPMIYEFYLSGNLVRCFHALPHKDNETILNIDLPYTKRILFRPTNKTSNQNADVVVYGHIHHQYVDKLYNKTIINAGSVGNAFDTIRDDSFDSDKNKTTQAFYVILEGKIDSKECSDMGIDLISIPYDINKELEDIMISHEVETYQFELENGMYRNMGKVDQKFKELNIKIKDDVDGKK